MDAFFLSFGVIFLAELGDKSQLMALAFASRYRASIVLVAVTLATLLVHAFSVLVGVAFAVALPTDSSRSSPARRSSGSRHGRCAATSSARPRRAGRRRTGRWALLTIGTAFFLAELGDKTMLATITLATTEEPMGDVAGVDLRHGRG